MTMSDLTYETSGLFVENKELLDDLIVENKELVDDLIDINSDWKENQFLCHATKESLEQLRKINVVLAKLIKEHYYVNDNL